MVTLPPHAKGGAEIFDALPRNYLRAFFELEDLDGYHPVIADLVQRCPIGTKSTSPNPGPLRFRSFAWK
jgi:hypothetical protein